MNDSQSLSKNQNDKSKKTPLEWARFWFHKLARFHGVQDPARWKFTEQMAVSFRFL